MAFSKETYEKLISELSTTQERLFPQTGRTDITYDVAIVGSGIGGGTLADDLADKLESANNKRILLLEAGSYLVPTHVYNISRFSNADVARKYAVKTFTQTDGPGGEYYIHEEPQLNFGGRSVFWSGLIPAPQPWELTFSPPQMREGIRDYLGAAEKTLNISKTMGGKAQEVVEALRRDPFLSTNFEIQETPRALHQPYLTPGGQPGDQFWLESTGVFNTAELLINQIGLDPGNNQNPLDLLLNHYVESVEQTNDNCTLNVTDVLSGESKQFTAKFVILAGGTLESPKILRRSPVFNTLTPEVQNLVGKGLTDHPTTYSVRGTVTNIRSIDIPKDSHAKIIFYSKGLKENDGSIRYPFNIEMNINHEYWHLRENDANNPENPVRNGWESIVDIKFSFGNPIDDENSIQFGDESTFYVPQIRFRNLDRYQHTVGQRFNLLAGWNKSPTDVKNLLNDLTYRIFSQFQKDGNTAEPDSYYGEGSFGYGTVHHAVGTLRMPYKTSIGSSEFQTSVVDENLMVADHPNLYVCDMSVMPYSASANPVTALAAMALRLSDHILPQL